MIRAEGSAVEDIARREGGAFGRWVTSDVPLPLSAGPSAGRRSKLRIREGRADRRLHGDVALRELGVTSAFDGEVSPSRRTVWLDRGQSAIGLCWGAVLGLVLPHLVYARGLHILHAGSVSRDCGAVAFTGPARAGKSSVAAALVHRGWRLVSDDALPVVEAEGCTSVLPAYPAIRLFTPTASWFVEGDDRRMVQIHPGFEKWWVTLDQARQWHGAGPVPLRCLCLLDRSGLPSMRLRGAEATLAVLAASYRSPVGGGERLAQDFGVVHRLAATVPVVRLTLPPQLPPAGSLADLVMERMVFAGAL